MRRLLAPLRRPLPSLLTFAAVLGMSFWVGCGNDDKNPMNPGGATSSSFAGWLGNGNESGMLTLTVSMANLAGRLPAPGAASVTVTATGFLTHSGGTTDTLNGIFDDETGYVDVAGGGYTLAGVYDPGPPSVMFGTYTGPNGSGDFACRVGGVSSADIYCGTFENEAQLVDGTFIVAVRGTELEGAAIESGSSNPTGFTGTVSGTGTIRTFAFSSTITGGYKLIGSGQVNTSTHLVGGTYKIEYNTAPYDSGTWSGELCQP
jgi:hypothetical protein